MKVLFAISEAFPLIKTGGLGDVANSLPNSLQQSGADVRLILPAYREVLQKTDSFKILGWMKLGLQQDVRILETRHPAFEMPIWLVDHPGLFDRPGNPYSHPEGYDWRDNPLRFSLFSQVTALMAIDTLKTGWRADVMHTNDWQTGLVNAYLSHEAKPPKRIFTIHNIAYDCQFDFGTFQSLHLPPHWWSMELGEFHHRFSLLKAGLVFSDKITTVSPKYAREIRTPDYGYGYAPILEESQHKLSGILNGIDCEVWNPATDPYLQKHYSAQDKISVIRKAKTANKKALLSKLGASSVILEDIDKPLIGFVGRLVFQKGVDLLLNSIDALIHESNARFVIIGNGERDLEHHLKRLVSSWPDRVFSFIGYSEALAHMLEAGSDIFAMPSRYEPCGLNQLYSLRYGTPPVVRRTGGLADTVSNQNGVLFDEATPEALTAAIHTAITYYNDKKVWCEMISNAMEKDYSWQKSAGQYLELYKNV
jgi:starch synthase